MYECGPKGLQERKFKIRILFVFESRRLETSDVHFKVYKVTRNIITFITCLSILVDLSDWGGREEKGRKVVMLLEGGS